VSVNGSSNGNARLNDLNIAAGVEVVA
jgi:hypothetical protein